MCFTNRWYAAIFESHANNPKPKTNDTGSRFVLNSSVKQLSGGESLSENQNINEAEVSFCVRKLRFKSSNLGKPSIQPPLQGQIQVGNRKCGNPDHPEVGKSEINQR